MRDTVQPSAHPADTCEVNELLVQISQRVQQQPYLQLHNIRQHVMQHAHTYGLSVDWAGERRGQYIWIELSDQTNSCYTLIVPAPICPAHESDGW